MEKSCYKIDLRDSAQPIRTAVIKQALIKGYDRGEGLTEIQHEHLKHCSYIVLDPNQPIRWSSDDEVYQGLHEEYEEITAVDFIKLG